MPTLSRPSKSGPCGLQVPETSSIQAPGPWHMLFFLCRTLFYHVYPACSLVYFLSLPKFPLLWRPLQPYYFKIPDHSHSTPCPFPCFYFLHRAQPFLVYHLSYLHCSLFLTLPPLLSSNRWNAKLQEARDTFVFIFCSCNPSHKNSIWHMIGTQ